MWEEATPGVNTSRQHLLEAEYRWERHRDQEGSWIWAPPRMFFGSKKGSLPMISILSLPSVPLKVYKLCKERNCGTVSVLALPWCLAHACYVESPWLKKKIFFKFIHLYQDLEFWYTGSLIFLAACRVFSCSMKTLSCSMWIWLPDQGLNLGPLYWEVSVLAIGPPGKSLDVCWLMRCTGKNRSRLGKEW